MTKQAPTLRQLAAVVTFSAGCLGILIFLWISFGGSSPLRPQGYRFQVSFPEAGQLYDNADVRISGISVGKVRGHRLDPRSNRVLTTLEMKAEYAPVPRNTHAILRIKTLGGETFVELTPGDRRRGPLPDGGRLADGQVAEPVQLDEIFSAFDPATREAARRFIADSGRAVGDRGEELNDALGSLEPFAREGADLAETLDLHRRAVGGLVRDAGAVFEAVSQDRTQLRNLVTGASGTLGALASESDSLAETVRILPTFLDESKATLARFRGFARTARPLVRELRPVARDLGPTIAEVRRLSPDLRHVFATIDPLTAAAREGLPALGELFTGVRPLLGALGPFAEELNPILEWLELYQYLSADFMSGLASQLAQKEVAPSQHRIHIARATDVEGLEGVAIWPRRLPTNRGNAYLPPLLEMKTMWQKGIFPNFDCKPSGGEVEAEGGVNGHPACFVAKPLTFQGRRQGAFPHVRAYDYRRQFRRLR